MPGRRIAAAALLLLPSCGNRVVLPEQPEGLSPARRIEILRERQARVTALAGEGRGSLTGTEDGGAFRWQCWAQGTSRLRLQLSHRLKGLLADVLLEGDRVSLRDPEGGEVRQGALADVRPAGLSQLSSLLRLLAGPADTLACPDPADPARLTLETEAGNVWELRLSLRYGVYESAELREKETGRGLCRVTFDLASYREISGHPWPMSLVVDQPGEDWKLRISFEDVRLGGGIDPGRFDLKTP